MRFRITIAALLIFVLMSLPVYAAEVVEETRPAFGAHGMYSFVPDGLVAMNYEERTSISAPGYGLWTSYGFGAFDLLMRVTNFNLLIGEGYWLPRDGSIDDRFYIETNLGLVALDLSAVWKWRVHEAVEPFVGPTLGMGFFYGQVNEYKMGPDGESHVDDPEDKQMPPVVPLVGFIGGCRFYPHENFRISIDLGVLTGLYAGLSLGYAF